MDGPLTQREINKRETTKNEEPKIRVTNKSKGVITIQLREAGSDFYVGERSIHIGSGKSYIDRQSLFNQDQLSNLQARGDIRFLSDNA